jgi:hypothetical protein
MISRQTRRALWHRAGDAFLIVGFAFISGVILLAALFIFAGAADV